MYILKLLPLELLCIHKIDLNQFTIIAASPSKWEEGGVYLLNRLVGEEKTMFTGFTYGSFSGKSVRCEK